MLKRKFFSLLFFIFLYSIPFKTFASESGYLMGAIMGTGLKLGWGCEKLGEAESPNVPCSPTDDTNMTVYLGGFDEKDENGQPVTKGAIPQLFAMSMSMYDSPPADTGLYFADLFQQTPFSTNTTAYAQSNVGIGFAALSPVLGIWKVFRNMSYLLFTLAFMVVGFAIMFRAKLNPQTVVNIQLALPRMVITLLLITFSYAIAGLLVDIMYISIYLIVFMFRGVFKGEFAATVALDDNVLTNILNTMFGFGRGSSVLTGSAGVTALVAGALGFDKNADLAANFGGNILGAIAGFGVGLLFLLIFTIVIFVKAFKAFFMLLSAYIQIIMLVITGPLRLILNIYPGSNAFMDWIKELAANLAIFPATIVMLLIGFSLLGIETNTGIGFATTQSTGFSPPQLFFKDQRAVMALLGIGIIISIDTVGDKVKGLFGVGGGGQGGGGGAFAGGLLGGGIGAALGPGLAPFKAIAGAGTRYGMSVAGDVGGGMARNLVQNERVQQLPFVKRITSYEQGRRDRQLSDAAQLEARKQVAAQDLLKTRQGGNAPDKNDNQPSGTPANSVTSDEPPLQR